MSSSEDPRLRDLRSKLRQVALQGREAAAALERGQAEMPVVALFEGIENDLRGAPLTVALLGLTVEARTAALSWLCGRDHRLFTIHVPPHSGLIEVQLLDRSYVLETPDGQRREFTEPGELLEALRTADLLQEGDRQSWIDPLRVRLPAEASHEGLTVVMAENLDVLTRRPDLLSYLLSRTNVLALAAPAAWPWPETGSAALQEVIRSFPVLLPVVPMASASQRGGWWTAVAGIAEMSLPPLVLDLQAGPEALAVTRERRERLGTALSISGLARRGVAACQLVADRHDTLLRQATARQRREARRESGVESGGLDTELRATAERIKSLINDDLSKLGAAIKESSRRALLKSGPLRESALARIRGLAEQDLLREEGSRSIRLSVSEGFIRELMRELRKELRAQLDADLILLRDGIGELRRAAEESLRAAWPVSISLPLNPPDDRDAWVAMKELLDVDIRYRGEIPRRGFIDRLSEGRRLVFAGLMVVSLAGSFLGLSNVRGMVWVGLLFLLVFIASVVYTYRSWSHQDAEALTKELDKVRDSLSTEIGRVLADAEREKLTRLTAQLDTARKAALQAVDQLGRDAQQRRAQVAGQQRREAAVVLRNLEGRLRDLQALGQRVGKLTLAAGEADQLARQWLRDLARAGPPAVPGDGSAGT